ncbi:MAG: transporter permease [Herminiimonas sp.]|nr:transporter permease [Herminiimonas sp.]
MRQALSPTSATAAHAAQLRPHRWAISLAVLFVAALSSVVLACLTGSVTVPLADMPAAFGELVGGGARQIGATLLALRLDRAATAFVTGGSLALAGAMMQALLRNPLADPYVLGISGGAAVGAVASLLLGMAAWVTDLSALGGALLISALLYLLARRDLRSGVALDGGTSLLLLTGVILSSGCMALVTLMLSIAPESRLRSMVFWMIGDLSGGTFRVLPALLLMVVLIFTLRLARAINVMALYADGAATLGVPVARLRQALFVCSGLLTASAVSSAGSIGFVGLIVPHAVRFSLGPDHRLLLPASMLAGGAFLVVADTVARTLLAPQQLPVGVITAMIGVPVFLIQLHQLRQR